MYNEKLISIIMGIYNCADTLENAVNSIINQTYTNWELIMCDDGSSDDTYKIALELANKDSRIIVLKNENNMTLAPTLNKCIDYAKGEYIARMDGDDVCSNKRFQKEYDFLESHSEYAFVSCLMEIYDDNGIYNVINYKEIPNKYDLVKESQFCHAGCMIRKDALLKVNCYTIDSKHCRVEDYDLWFKLYKNGYKGYNLQEVLYSMRDDRNAFKRRNINNRLNEARIQSEVISNFNLSIVNYIYPFITLLKCLVPNFIYTSIHKNRK